MVAKKLCVNSIFNKYDTNLDGTVDDDEINNAQDMLELELREEKADAHRRMAWIALISMIVFTIGLFLPWISDSRVSALADLLGLFYIAQAGVVGTYMGVTAWMSKDSVTPLMFSSKRQFKTESKKVPMSDSPEI